MLSITADYALRAVLLLGASNGRCPLSADEVARAIGAPANYLAKTLNASAKAGIVRSTRGPHGGFTLAVSPTDLSLARIVDLFEDRKPGGRCLLGKGSCDPSAPCTAHSRWSRIAQTRRAALAGTMI